MKMLTPTSVFSFIPDSLASLISSRRYALCSILRLPIDVCVDHIFIYLCLEDILCLRRTCKTIFFMTHEPIIWKRFLQRLHVPHAPLRPTFRYSLRKTDYEIEQLVIRAITLDENWRAQPTQVLNCRQFTLGQQVSSLKFLPGGRYLVAAQMDKKGYRHSIVLFDADNPRGVVATARFPTLTKAYHLDAKYMKFNGEWGIMISWIERRFTTDYGSFHPSEFDTETDIDPPSPFLYECGTYFISLEWIQRLTDPIDRPRLTDFPNQGPFQEVSVLQSPNKLERPNLFMFLDRPFVAVAKQPDEIIIQELTEDVGKQEFSVLKCEPVPDFEACPHYIVDFRILPLRPLNILITRKITVSDTCDDELHKNDIHVVEVYSPPEYGQTTLTSSRSYVHLPNKKYSKIRISDVPPYFVEGVDHPEVACLPRCGPQPVSIFCETMAPLGIMHYAIWPLELPVPGSNETSFSWDLTTTCWQSFRETTPFAGRILPGMNRSLMFVHPADDRTSSPPILKVCRYICPETQPAEFPLYQRDPTLAPVSRQPRRGMPQKLYSTVRFAGQTAQMMKEDAMSGAAWDETSGRLCCAFLGSGMVAPSMHLAEFSHFLKAEIVPRFAL